MTDTLISLISIFIGIIAGNSTGFIFKKYSLGTIGNTIVGVFGSILFIKLFGRLGFDPVSIMQTGEINRVLFFINMLVSFLGGSIGLVLANFVIKKLSKT